MSIIKRHHKLHQRNNNTIDLIEKFVIKANVLFIIRTKTERNNFREN